MSMNDQEKRPPLIFECFRDSLIGRNARGIIHNINTPLQILSMQIGLMRMDVMKMEQMKETHDADSSCRNNDMELAEFTRQIGSRLEQMEMALEHVNALMNLLSGHVDGDAGSEVRKPVVLNDLLEEHVRFWMSDLFFKHQVHLSINLPEISPVINTFEAHLRDVIDGTMYGCLEALKQGSDPELKIDYFSLSGHKYTHRLSFIQNGALFPADELRMIAERLVSEGGFSYSNLENLSRGLMAFLLAYVNAGAIGCALEIEKDQVNILLQ